MTRRTRFIAIALVLIAVLAALVAGRLLMRKGDRTAAASASASAPAAVALELSEGDVAHAEVAEMTTLLTITGSLKAVQSAVVKARVASELQKLTVREGDSVQAGQLIGQLDATENRWRLRQAEDQANAAQAQLDIADRALANNKALVDQGFISRTALDTSVSNSMAASASLQAARAAAELARKAVSDSEIRAPIAGLVSQRLVQPGERVSIDTRLVEIVDLSRIELEAAVPPEDVPSLRVGQVARVQIDGLAQPVTARVVRINPSAQSGTRSVMAYLELAPVPGLRQGLFGRGTIELLRRKVLAVPSSTLRFDQARPYVLAVENGVAVLRWVSVGARGGVARERGMEPSAEIIDGLPAGSLVLRGTVGSLAEGTRVKLATAAAAAAGGTPASAAAAR